MNRCALTIRMLMILRARGTKYPVSTRVLAQELETNPRNIREFKKELVTAGFNIIEKKGLMAVICWMKNSLCRSLV